MYVIQYIPKPADDNRHRIKLFHVQKHYLSIHNLNNIKHSEYLNSHRYHMIDNFEIQISF